VQFATSASLLALAVVAVGQTPPPATPPATKPQTLAPAAPVDPMKAITDATKDFEKLPGVLTFYRKKTDTSDTIYAEITPDKLDKLMLLQVTNSGGTQGTSSDIAPGLVTVDLPLKFKRLDDNRLLLIQPNTGLRATRSDRVKLLDRSFPESIIQTFPAVAKSADGKTVLINLSSFLKSDVAELGSALTDPRGIGYGISNESSYVDSFKNLPDNVSYRVNHFLQRRGPAGSGARAVYRPVSYSWSLLPDSDYRPRFGDPRVGYFTTYFRTADSDSSLDTGVNYILRWNLKKKDPKAALSEPVKPITFWIDNATPPQYRDDVREALLMWNPAFERVGIKNAIVVKQMPDNADWDIADVRYNVVRWTVGQSFAIALFRSNPMTGEIINASINMDGGFASAGTSEFDTNFDGMRPTQVKELFRPRLGKATGKHDERVCARAEGGRTSLELGLSASELAGETKLSRDEYIRQYIVEVVAHEMGHIIGLRHNFAASNGITAKQLTDANLVKKEGITSSVMDYNAANLFAIGKPGVNVYSQTIGKYDKWAVEYGYKDIVATTPEGERYALTQIARLGGTPGLRYESDGTANGIDPSVQTFDLAANNLDFYEKELQTAVMVMKTAASRGSKIGQSFYPTTRRFQSGFRGFLDGTFGSVSTLGGVKLGNSFVGDPSGQLPSKPFPVAEQRRSIDLITKYVLSPDSLPVTPEILSQLTFNPNQDGNEGPGRAPNLLDSMISIRALCVSLLLDPAVLRQVANNEFRTPAGADRITGPEIVTKVVNATMKNLTAGTPTDLISRNTQRTTVNELILLCRNSAATLGDARLSARTHLKEIQGQIGKRKYPAADAAHYADLNATIDRFFKQVAIWD